MPDLSAVAEILYVRAMRSGERERRDLPVDADYWQSVASNLTPEEQERVIKEGA